MTINYFDVGQAATFARELIATGWNYDAAIVRAAAVYFTDVDAVRGALEAVAVEAVAVEAVAYMPKGRLMAVIMATVAVAPEYVGDPEFARRALDLLHAA